MKTLAEFESLRGRGWYRPHGHASAVQLVDMISAALALARTEHLLEIVINITRMEGFESPDPTFRRWAVRRWADASQRSLRIVIVAHAEHICPQKTGLLAAAEEGLAANIFETEEEAVQWLDHAEPVAPAWTAGRSPFAR